MTTPPPHHPRFVDMTGRKVGQSVVLRRAPNKNGVACWICLCPCGEEFVAMGIVLRQAERDGRTPKCATCHPRKPREPRVIVREPVKRPRVKLCRLCCGMPHRVRGRKCRSCGLLRHD